MLADEGQQTNPPLGSSQSGGSVTRPVQIVDCQTNMTCTMSGTTLQISSSGGGGGGGGGTTAHNLLSGTHSDTTTGSPVQGALISGTSGNTWARLLVGLAGQYPRSNGTDFAWSGLSTADITTGTVAVANGGTGKTTFTLNGVLFGNGTSPVNVTAQGATNTVLVASAGAPSFTTQPTLTNLTATDTVTGATVVATGTFQLPITATAVTQTSGTMLIDNTNDQLIFRGGGTTDRVITYRSRKCAFFENLTSSDTTMPVFTFERPATVLASDCKVNSFSTNPTYQLFLDTMGASAMPILTCSEFGGVRAYDQINTQNTVTGAGVTLMMSVMNTPAPVFGTKCLLCVVFAEAQQ